MAQKVEEIVAKFGRFFAQKLKEKAVEHHYSTVLDDVFTREAVFIEEIDLTLAECLEAKDQWIE